RRCCSPPPCSPSGRVCGWPPSVRSAPGRSCWPRRPPSGWPGSRWSGCRWRASRPDRGSRPGRRRLMGMVSDVSTPAGPRAVTAVAPAKINLHLAVGDVRADGFHELVTVYRAVDLWEQVTVAFEVPGRGEGG